MGDLHGVVVHDVGQVVGGHAVALEEHLVVKQTAVHRHVAAYHVVHRDVYVVGEHEAHHVGLAGVYAALRLFLAEADAVLHGAACGAVVLEGLFLCLVFLALGFQRFGLVEGVVGPAVAYQLVGILAVHGLAVALAVGAVGAADMHAFVKLYAQPVEGLDDVLFGTRHEACLVGVLDAQYHLAAVLAREEVVVEGCAHAPDVQWPRR